MLTNIYNVSSITALLVLSIMLTRYIFLIPPFHKWLHHALYMLLTWGTCAVCSYFLGITPALATLGVAIGVYIFLTGTGGKRRYFRILQTIPVLGIAFGLFYPPLEIPMILLGMSQPVSQIYGLVIFSLLAIAVIVFAFAGRRWRKGFREDMQFRHLLNWERSLLYVIGTLMFIFASNISSYTDLPDGYYRSIVMRSCCVTSMIVFIVTLTIIILILQGNKSAHFREQVLRMQHNIIITMADIVENRDENTGGHIRRTAKYVEIIAIKLKAADLYGNILTEQYIADMIIAAPLHDIGKIHIPDAVLKKEGRFTPEEYEIMKSHTTAGSTLLQQAESTLGESSYLDIAVQMAHYHHEWWNGRGYPDGLKGQDIPLCARIMAVADVFDAIVSQRCYKGAMSVDEAYELIRKDSGTHFDPVVVDAFLEAREEITEVLHEFTEQPNSLSKVVPVQNKKVSTNPMPAKSETQENQETTQTIQI